MRVSNIKYDGDFETYQIHGGEAISIDLKKGDSVEIVDVRKFLVYSAPQGVRCRKTKERVY